MLEDDHRAGRFYEQAGFIVTAHVLEDTLGGSPAGGAVSLSCGEKGGAAHYTTNA